MNNSIEYSGLYWMNIFLNEYFGFCFEWIFFWMNILDFVLNWILNWIIFRPNSMKKWIFKTYRTGLGAIHLVGWKACRRQESPWCRKSRRWQPPPCHRMWRRHRGESRSLHHLMVGAGRALGGGLRKEVQYWGASGPPLLFQRRCRTLNCSQWHMATFQGSVN